LAFISLQLAAEKIVLRVEQLEARGRQVAHHVIRRFFFQGPEDPGKLTAMAMIAIHLSPTGGSRSFYFNFLCCNASSTRNIHIKKDFAEYFLSCQRHS
jgi:hypothetical protein